MAVTNGKPPRRTPHRRARLETAARTRWLPWAAGTLILIAGIAALWRFSPLHEVADTRAIAGWLHGLRNSSWAPLILVLVYVAANAVFFPNTVLNTATILGFGTTHGLPYALTGSLIAALPAYALGRRYGKERLKNLDSAQVDRMTKLLRDGGVLGMATLRLLPIAPYGVVNALAGAARVRILPFMSGTLLGLLPGGLLVTAFGHQLRAVLRHPTPMQIAIMLAIVLLAGSGAWWLRGKALEG